MTTDLAEPPSTVAEVRSLLIDYDATRPRTMQTRLGPSELGTPCPRQIALKLAGVPRQPVTRPAWAPLQGTAVHELMADVLEMDNARRLADGRGLRWLVERELLIAGERTDPEKISGHGDAYDLLTGSVIDWKHTGTTAIKKLRRRNVPRARLVSQDYRVQQHLYGLGHERAGRTVRWVRLVLLARSHDFDQSAEWTEPYRPDVALWAITRFYSIRDAVINGDMARHPERLAEIPVVRGDPCVWCPFRRPGPEADATGCAGDTAQRADRAADQWAGLI